MTRHPKGALLLPALLWAAALAVPTAVAGPGAAPAFASPSAAFIVYGQSAQGSSGRSGRSSGARGQAQGQSDQGAAQGREADGTTVPADGADGGDGIETRDLGSEPRQDFAPADVDVPAGGAAAGPPSRPAPPAAPPRSSGTLFGDGSGGGYDGPFSFQGIVKIIGAFILVIALLLLFLKLLGRFSRGRSFSEGKGFTLRATMTLDSRRYLAAVEVDGRLLVIAVTGDRVTPLAHWTAEDIGPEPASGFHPGSLGLEPDDGVLFGAPDDPPPRARTEKPVPRPGVKEPAFLRGEVEDEDAPAAFPETAGDVSDPGEGPPEAFAEGEGFPAVPPAGDDPGPSAGGEGFTLGIDEDGFDGPQTDDEFMYADPRGPSGRDPGE